MASVRSELGDPNGALDDSDTALRIVEPLLQLDPDNLEVLMALGEMWNSRGQPSRAMPYFKRVRDLEPGHGGANAAIESYLSGKQAVPARRTTTVSPT